MLYEETLTTKIISCAIEIHSVLGPGLLESAYEKCLCHEFTLRKISFQRQKSLPIVYKGISLPCSYRMDVVVEEKVVVEIKTVDSVLEVHKAQLLTYLKLSKLRVGLLFNFSAKYVKDGLVRFVL